MNNRAAWSQDVLWEGILLSYLLNLAGVSIDKVDRIVFEAVTGYKKYLKGDSNLSHPDNMIALKAEGAPNNSTWIPRKSRGAWRTGRPLGKVRKHNHLH